MTDYSRAQWGARPADGGPGNLTPSRVEGIALHWPAMTTPIKTVDGVKAALRSWQNYHMDGHGWSDIAYQVAVDQAGNRYELRGLATQSGANGDTDVNERFGAMLLILAPGEEPTDAMITEVRAVITDHRHLFPNSHRIVGHTDIRPEPTSCPGPAAIRLIRAGAFEPTPQEDDMPTPDEIADAIWKTRLDRPGSKNATVFAGVALSQAWNRAGGAREAANAALKGQAELAALIKELPGATDGIKAAIDEIVTRTAAEVQRLDADAVADRLEITTKEK